MNERKHEERREAARLEDNIFLMYHFNHRVFKGITKNISEGGLMFETDRKIPVGADLEFEIYQPMNSFKTLIYIITAVGKVAWEKRIKYGLFEEGENKYSVGIEFVKIKNDDRQRIASYINEKTG